MKRRWTAWLLMLAILIVSVVCMPTAASAAANAKLSATSKMIEVGKSFTLTVSGTKAKVTYSTANKAVATVTAKGVVTAKKVGSTTITAKVGSQKLTCSVRVTYKRTKFTLRGQTFTMAIPPTWTYQYVTYGSKSFVQFYDKYIYEHFDGRGSLITVAAYTDQELAKLNSIEACIPYGKLGKYNFGAYYQTGYGLYGDKTADDKFQKSLKQCDSIANTFRPVASTAKQRAYNAYFQYLTNAMCVGCPFALAYITNDNIPELIIDKTLSKYNSLSASGDTIEIYTYKGGKVQLLCKTGRDSKSAGYYFQKNVAVGIKGNTAIGTHYYNVSKNIELLNHVYSPYSGGAKHTYYNAAGRQIKKATFDAALKKYTGGKKLKHYNFYKNTIANRKKYLHN